MTDTAIQTALETAVGQAFDAWAVEHPSLAAVIDRLAVTERTVERLRETDAYKQALADYHAARNETDLAHRLLDFASPLIAELLGA